LSSSASKLGNESLFERRIYRGSSIRVVEKDAFHYPLLSNVARRYLITPATSVPSERVFSAAGHITNQKHACLLPENVRILVSLAENLQ